jgi:hypothetical protein
MPIRHRIVATALLLALGCALGGMNCGDPLIDGSCDTHCDCDQTTAPVKTPGEWLCNEDKCCEYVPTGLCDDTTPCRAGQTCPAAAGGEGFCFTPRNCE